MIYKNIRFRLCEGDGRVGQEPRPHPMGSSPKDECSISQWSLQTRLDQQVRLTHCSGRFLLSVTCIGRVKRYMSFKPTGHHKCGLVYPGSLCNDVEFLP